MSTDAKGVWCLAEVRHGQLIPTVFELIHVGRGLADTLKEPLSVVLVGKDVAQHAQDMVDRGADQVYVLDHAVFENFTDDLYAQALADLAQKEKPNKFLVPGSIACRSLAARLSVKLNAGLAADATALSLDAQGSLVAVRSCFGGNIVATVGFDQRRPEMATVRPMCFPRAEKSAGRQARIVNVPVDPAAFKSRTKFVKFEADQSGVKDIGGAEIIVSGGRGVGGPEGFKPVEALAKALGAAVGASRAAVDAGWIPYRHQVGLTGRTVRPKLYIACGISGQIQHLAGMSAADVIVAINKDPQAPLMKLANLSVQADLFELIPALIKEIEKRRN